jgi:hypothetical protein
MASAAAVDFSIEGVAGPMDCPYCAEPVKDSALTCKHCAHDLFVIRPLMTKLADATARLEAFEQAYPSGEHPVALTAARAAPAASLLPGLDPLAAMAMTFILLVVSHYLIVVEYNLSLVFLRCVSIVIPLVFGFFCRESGRRTMAVEFVYGVVVAVLSILVMATIVGKIDHVPVLPRDHYEWREFAEYGASIAFGFFTGVVIRQTVIAMRTQQAAHSALIALISKMVAEKLGGRAAGFNVRTIQSLVSMAVAAGSAITSIISGLRLFF